MDMTNSLTHYPLDLLRINCGEVCFGAAAVLSQTCESRLAPILKYFVINLTFNESVSLKHVRICN